MISYRNLCDAVDYYSSHGFTPIEVPWVVSGAALDITRPAFAKPEQVDGGMLVASGEQSFLQLILDKGLTPGRWLCVTPCFRLDSLDRYHQRHFTKVELIDTKDTSVNSLNELTAICLNFFQWKLPGSYVENTNHPDPILVSGTGRDINSPRGVELGSYGIHRHPMIGSWIYATGCAEPRLSLAIEDA